MQGAPALDPALTATESAVSVRKIFMKNLLENYLFLVNTFFNKIHLKTNIYFVSLLNSHPVLRRLLQWKLHSPGSVVDDVTVRRLHLPHLPVQHKHLQDQAGLQRELKKRNKRDKRHKVLALFCSRPSTLAAPRWELPMTTILGLLGHRVLVSLWVSSFCCWNAAETKYANQCMHTWAPFLSELPWRIIQSVHAVKKTATGWVPIFPSQLGRGKEQDSTHLL